MTNQWFTRMEEHMVLLDALIDHSYKNYRTEIQQTLQNWKDFNSSKNINVYQLMNMTRDLKVNLLNLSQKQYTGLYPSLLLHMIKELDFVSGLLDNSLSLSDVVAFWGDHALDYAKLDPHMIDPTQEDIISIINNMKDELQSLNDMVLSTDKINILIQDTMMSKDMHIAGQQVHVPSIIHPVLLQHMIAEEQMGINMLTSILNNMGQI
ncbi:Hypothetical protein ORPV_81 [Orpheovirus IHUMI-LCC2]|uniref:Uncharacterized protein n=1 Tax=Orpheovirus IHUMI-LCC2 TaxID=2023057 RepID=A0A2I2L361_9VIRU|nr:Hypothetical protein ORPV_81 [Orpheovirus IHUMI-LCC2]SNW61985.1 Hypothetical protein ORPV_81 [Orpheovirus IHUMI-LCC2]